ncbi:MAG: DUF1800 domain-containing protein [Vicinamibacterales bacterium]|nr:DUF1800 domain-containing protein [Vicinamibacterales bacterium]HJN44387.1 DUF1800 domain-containing protein [Vicinamibacterales bacterium]
MGTRRWLAVLVAVSVWTGVPAGAEAGQGAAGPPAWVGDLSPIGPEDWGYDRAAHLLERAGFGETPDEIARFAAMTPEAAVNYLVDYEAVDNSNLPAFEHSRDAQGRKLFHEILKPSFPLMSFYNLEHAEEFGESLGVMVDYSDPRNRNQEPAAAGYFMVSASRMEMDRAIMWWTNRMLNTRRPLEEKMVLFWHGHFATQHLKLHDYEKMLVQQAMFREHATANFRDLLVGIGKDPAMIRYLDNVDNVVGHANENFAREIMELFAMGEGRGYTERDVREAARAFTGWTFDPQNEHQFVFRPDAHDYGAKTIFGQTGNFRGEDVVDLILQQEVTAGFMAPKIYRFFVREDPSPELQDELAAVLRDASYELKPLLRTILLSRDFYSSASYATHIKSPIHLVVSTYKKLGVTEVPGTPNTRFTTQALGQEPFNPPNVAGWEGGPAWINPATVLARANFAKRVFFPEPEPNLNTTTFATQSRCGRMGCIDTTGMSPVLADMPVPSQWQRTPREAPASYDEADAPMRRRAASARAAGRSVEVGTDARVVAPNPEQEREQRGWERGYAIPVGQARARALSPAIPLTVADIDLVAMTRGAGLTRVDAVVDYFIRRFLRTRLSESRRQVLVDVLTRSTGSDTIDHGQSTLETSLRETLLVLMGMAEYQLS